MNRSSRFAPSSHPLGRSRWLGSAAVVVVLAAASGPGATLAYGLDGDLDPAFGAGTGVRAFAYDLGGDHADRCGDLAVRDDGVTVIGGSSSSITADKDWVISWLGDAGNTLYTHSYYFDLGGSNADTVGAVAFDSGRRTLIAGSAASSDRTELRVCRTNPNDSGLDPDWNGGSCLAYDLGAGTELLVRRVAEAHDGGVLVAGTLTQPTIPSSDENWFVLKLTSTGGIESGFGFFGIRVLAWNVVGHGTDRLTDMVVDRRSDTIFLVGSVQGADGYSGRIAKLTGAGNLDLSWGPLGGYQDLVLKDGFTPLSTAAQAVLLDPVSGVLWVALQANSPSGVQLGTTGIKADAPTLSESVEFSWSSGTPSEIRRIVRQSDGRFLVVGSTASGTKFQVSRFEPFAPTFAALDPSFGNGGTASNEPDALGWGVGQSVCGAGLASGRPVFSGTSDRGDLDQLVFWLANELIFSDGFETGDDLEWSPTVF